MEDHFTTIGIRNASSQDAEEIVDILNNSFDPNDEQRILGTNATISLVKLLIKQHDTLFFIAEEQNDIVGYIWGQTKKLSLLKSLFNTPLLLLKFCFSCIAHNKLISILKYILKQKTQFNCVFTFLLLIIFPKFVSQSYASPHQRKNQFLQTLFLLYL